MVMKCRLLFGKSSHGNISLSFTPKTPTSYSGNSEALLLSLLSLLSSPLLVPRADAEERSRRT